MAEGFAIKRGAPLRKDIQLSEPNRLQLYLAANYYMIVIDNTVFGRVEINGRNFWNEQEVKI